MFSLIQPPWQLLQSIELIGFQSQLAKILLRRARRSLACGATHLRAAHRNRPMNQALRGRHRHQRRDFAAAAGLTEYRDVDRMTAERGDVLLDPAAMAAPAVDRADWISVPACQDTAPPRASQSRVWRHAPARRSSQSPDESSPSRTASPSTS